MSCLEESKEELPVMQYFIKDEWEENRDAENKVIGNCVWGS